jgi:hypothetical protein
LCEEIKKLVEKGCILEVSENPRVLNPSTYRVVGNRFKQSLVLDYKRIKFKYEDASTSIYFSRVLPFGLSIAGLYIFSKVIKEVVLKSIGGHKVSETLCS